MPNTKDYLNELINQRDTLVTTLVAKGVPATKDETYNSLVAKVATIKQDEVKGEEIVLENFVASTDQSYKDIVPSEGKNAITKVRQPGVTHEIDSNITSENIKKDVSILGVAGDYICNYTYDESTKELVLIL